MICTRCKQDKKRADAFTDYQRTIQYPRCRECIGRSHPRRICVRCGREGRWNEDQICYPCILRERRMLAVRVLCPTKSDAEWALTAIAEARALTAKGSQTPCYIEQCKEGWEVKYETTSKVP